MKNTENKIAVADAILVWNDRSRDVDVLEYPVPDDGWAKWNAWSGAVRDNWRQPDLDFDGKLQRCAHLMSLALWLIRRDHVDPKAAVDALYKIDEVADWIQIDRVWQSINWPAAPLIEA